MLDMQTHSDDCVGPLIVLAYTGYHSGVQAGCYQGWPDFFMNAQSSGDATSQAWISGQYSSNLLSASDSLIAHGYHRAG